MGLYATPPPLAGGVWTSIGPGESYTLLNGTETIVTGSASFAFSLGYSPTGSNTKTFQVLGCAGGSVVQIQASNSDVAANYTVVQTQTGNGEYTDTGSSAFYRVKVSTFVGGDVPVVTVNRG